MFFLVCFHCVEVWTYEEGHCCPYSEGNEDERNFSNIVLIQAEPTHLKNSTASKDESTNNQWYQQKKRSRRGDFKLAIVESESDRKMSDMKFRTTYKIVCGSNEVSRTENLNPPNPEKRNASAELYASPAFPDNVACYSRQSTLPEINKFISTVNKRIAKYPAVSQMTSSISRKPAWSECNKNDSTQYARMEFQTTYYDVNDSNAVSRIEHIENFHPLGTRNILAESFTAPAFPENVIHYSRQSTRPQINKFISTINKSIAKYPAVSLQTSQSSRQHNTSLEGSEIIESSALPILTEIFICEKCGNRFKTRSAFNAHLSSNCDPNLFKCDICNRSFLSKGRLRQHSVFHKAKNFKCNMCEYAARWKVNLEKHVHCVHKI